MWQHSFMNLDKAIKSLEEEEAAIVENIKKGRTHVTHVGNAGAGTSRQRRYANVSHHNAGPSNSIRLFGTTLSYCERHEATEATLNLNKQKRDSTELGLPPTFVALPTLPVEVPQTVSQLRSPLGFSATPVSSSEKGKQIVGNQTSQLSRFSQDEPSTIVTTSRYPLAPTPAVAPAPAPAPVSLDRGKQPIQASGSSSVRARPEPNPRFNRINRNNTRR